MVQQSGKLNEKKYQKGTTSSVKIAKDEGIVTTQYDAILEIDHIKELEDYPELALENDNLRTRCKMHHNKKHKRFEFRENKKKRKWDDEWWGE